MTATSIDVANADDRCIARGGARPLASELLLLRGSGDGSFARAEGIGPAPDPGETLDDPADLDGDGRPDLVFVSAAGVVVRLGTR